ncbi:reverse transcriptase domain-containing protein [Tanacetum coccineum]
MPKEILVVEEGKFKPPPPMVTPAEKRSSNKFCDFHNDKGHSTDECMQLKKQIKELLNPKKYTFEEREGMFLGYMISPEGIKPCPKKTEVVLQLPFLRTIKEVQSLNGKLASLNRFLSKSAEKSWTLFKTLKKCIKKIDFHWTPEAEQAPLLVAPQPKEELIVYLAASQGAISAVLMTERDTVQMPVYFVSRALQGPELNYSPMEKLVLSLVFTAKRLRRYFQAHPIAVITDQPIKQIMSRPDVAGRLQKWSVMLGEHNITYRPRTSVKGHILADFLIEKLDENLPETPTTDIPQEPWTLFTDGSSCIDGSSTGLILTSPEVLVEILKEKSIHEEEVATVVEEEGTTYMTPIIEYLKDGTLPGDRKEASKLRIKARQYELLEGILYKRSFLKPWLRMHAVARSVVAKAMRLGYYWPIMHRDARETIRTCNDCQIHRLVPRNPQHSPTPIMAAWPFYKWGIDIAGPLSEESGNQVKKFLWDNIVCHFGLPGEIVSDNGKQFSDNPFKDCLGEGIKARLGEGNKIWVEELCHVLWAHRTMIKSSHGDTPFSLTYGTEAVIPVEIRMPTYRTAVVDTVYNDEELRLNLDLLEEKRDRTTICEAKAKMKMTKYYNARVCGVAFRPGDFVYRINDASHATASGKLGPKWEGPYEVTEALGDGAYKLRTMAGADLPRT